MASAIVVTINLPNDSIAQSKGKVFKTSTPGGTVVVDDQYTATRALINVLEGIQGGEVNATVKILVRDTDPAVATSGTGSTKFPA